MQIQLDHVSVEYGHSTSQPVMALRDVNLQIRPGEFAAVMGKTGCGKSTLLQVLAGLIQPSSGAVLLEGENIHQKGYPKTKLRKEIGILFQFPEKQLFETTVYRELSFGLRQWHLPQKEQEDRCRKALELLGFSPKEVWNRSPLSLSGGERRRAAVACLLAMEPKILLLDEPFAGLDPLGRESFVQLLKKLNQQGCTILLVTHHADCAASCAQRLILMSEGSVIADGDAKELFAEGSSLRRGGLKTSTPSAIAEQLRQRGVELEGTVADYSQLTAALKRRLGGGGR